MTVNIDTRRIPNVRVDGKLMALLQEMSHFNPAFNYEATDTLGYNEDKRISSVAVFLEGAPVGKVFMSSKYINASGAREVVYNVVSDEIRKRRGDRNTTTSKHMKIAMRAVREAFKRAEKSLIAERLIGDAQSKVERIQAWARDHARSTLIKATEPVLAYLQSIDDGIASASAGLPASLTQVMDPKWKDHLRDHRIASAVYKNFAAKHGVVVRIMRDETMQVANLQTTELTTIKSSYELPTNYQEKLTILKIMENDQPVEHVGFKFSDDERINGVRNEYQAFFLIDGPTYTNC